MHIYIVYIWRRKVLRVSWRWSAKGLKTIQRTTQIPRAPWWKVDGSHSTQGRRTLEVWERRVMACYADSSRMENLGAFRLLKLLLGCEGVVVYGSKVTCAWGCGIMESLSCSFCVANRVVDSSNSYKKGFNVRVLILIIKFQSCDMIKYKLPILLYLSCKILI